ncbi:unnamed protein product [Cylindrotheca closterium]|uniref:Uncharacterized protein n=1 Tax=Cylindrotheca closterium TaxID=2856 RepID=A0AAD2FPL2_9STRA|nr:unnamed protein product [Cylindrotheca closterium]
MCKSTDFQSTKERTVLKALSPNVSSRKRTLRQRKVCFSNEENAASSPLKEITNEHVANVWYSKGEIGSFKAQAKYLVLSGLPPKEDTFGLERYQLERSRQKRATVNYVVLSQKVNRDSEFQSYISRRNSSTSKEAALNQALENFCQVYDPLSSLLEGGDNYDEHFFAEDENTTGNKRSISDVSFNMAMIDETCHAEEEEPLPRVRQRTVAAVAC